MQLERATFVNGDSDAHGEFQAFPLALADALSNNHTLQERDVTSMPMSDEGYRAFADGVLANASLTEVRMPARTSGNRTGIETQVAEHVRKNRVA